MKTIAIIQARLNSTRFPRKVLTKIGDKTMLQCVIDRVKKAKYIDEIIIAIPKGEDIPFIKAKKFEGKENDVLDRYYQCAKKYKADTIVRITSDCPCIDPQVIDFAIDAYGKISTSYIKIAPIDGLDVEVFSYRILKEAYNNTTNKYDREHVTPYMKRATKISIDTPKDLERIKKWIDGKGL